MVHQLILKLQSSGIRFLVSPYESDAQLAFMSQMSQIDVVISEDSDSLVYGCKQVFFKMDSSGNGEHIKRCDLAKNKDLSFTNWIKASGTIQRRFTEDVSFLGPLLLDDVTSTAIACGRMNPTTRTMYTENVSTSNAVKAQPGKMSAKAEAYLQSIESLSVEEKRKILYGVNALPLTAVSRDEPQTTLSDRHSDHRPVERLPAGAVGNKNVVVFSTACFKNAQSAAAASVIASTSSVTEPSGAQSAAPPSTPPDMWAFDCPVDTKSNNARSELHSYTSTVCNNVLSGGNGTKKRSRRTAPTAAVSKIAKRQDLTRETDAKDNKFQRSAFRSSDSGALDRMAFRKLNVTHPSNESGVKRPVAVNWSGLDTAFAPRQGDHKRERRNPTRGGAHSDSEMDFTPSGSHSQPSSRAQFVSPLVSTRFMTLSRRQSQMGRGAGPLSGLSVSAQRGMSRRCPVAQDKRDTVTTAGSRVGSATSGRFFESDLFNSPDFRAEHHQPAVGETASHQPHFKSAHQQDPLDALLFGEKECEEEEEQFEFAALPPPASQSHQFGAADNDSEHIYRDGETAVEHHGILPPSPVLFKAASQIE
eukprot:gene34090-42037_t